MYVKYSVNLKYGNPESFLLNFLPLPLPSFFSRFRNPLSLPNTINESVSISSVKEFVEEQLETIAQTKGYKILEARVMPDHIHLFIEADPFDSPTNIVKIFKGVTGLRMSRKFPDFESKLWRGVMWSPSYYFGTAGHLSAETIERYIREQQTGGSQS